MHARTVKAAANDREMNALQVLDFPSVILLTMVVSVFTIFFPFLVVFVTGGILLETLANLLGLLGFSRVSIVQSSGEGLAGVTWMILWTQRIAIPVVMSCVWAVRFVLPRLFA